eukprot:5230085-Prymnesium_polylepis.1
MQSSVLSAAFLQLVSAPVRCVSDACYSAYQPLTTGQSQLKLHEWLRASTMWVHIDSSSSSHEDGQLVWPTQVTVASYDPTPAMLASYNNSAAYDAAGWPKVPLHLSVTFGPRNVWQRLVAAADSACQPTAESADSAAGCTAGIAAVAEAAWLMPVSYTHLTLPTICSV